MKTQTIDRLPSLRRFIADRIRRMDAILRRRQDTPEWHRNQGMLDEARWELARLDALIERLQAGAA